ncbi:MAG: type I methionyl aminopeptidase [Firmicutes bacterium]|nr:type I methionyl aminopeptidase [Bacillota bacterium]
MSRSKPDYNEKDYDDVRKSGQIIRDFFAQIEGHIEPGVSTLELDKIAHDFIVERGATPSFLNYQGFKHSICTSVNEESIHGIPRKTKILKNGDIISIDVGVRYPAKGGMCTDAARTFSVGEVSASVKKLIDVTEQSFHAAVDGLKAGSRVLDIGKRIEQFVNGRYGIIENFYGHGTGRNVHEGVLIPNFNVMRPDVNDKLVEMAANVFSVGDIICIEPMINMGGKEVRLAKDGWTVLTVDGRVAAHYENTMIITADGVEIIT